MNKSSQNSRFSAGYKVASIFLSAALLATTFTGLGGVIASPSIEADAATDYGLADNIQDGNILHCFCWKYTDITAMLPEIAEAGFTSVQVSPPQATSGTGAWWWVYQPKGFYIGDTELGNKEQLRTLCTEADKYGIKIIADIVANHLAGDHSVIQDDLKDSQYWHDYGGNADDGDRYRVTHGKIGMPDLNTEHSYVQQCVSNYIQELKSVGIDGIRFDAAKHIGLPSEGDQFWPTVTQDKSLWYYGEILNNPGLSFDESSGQRSQAISVMKEYSNYIGITDSPYGMTLRNSFNSGTAPSSFGNYCGEWMGLSNSRLLYWGESHDTWSNNQDWGYSNDMSQNVIDRAYAVAASRNGITALYFSRPSSKVKDDIKLGSKGSTHFTSKEVAAVNHFNNAMIGKADYYTVTNNCSVVTRKGGGAVLVKGSGGGQVTVENGGGYAAPGTYVDEVSGNTFTVTSTTISGTIGDSGIAVIYDSTPVTKSAVVSASPESSSFTDSVTVTMGVKNADNGTYQTSDGKSGTYTNGQTVTFGSSASVGSSVTLTLTATGSDGVTATKTYTYTKSDPNAKVMVYFDNSSYNWSSVYAYVYDDSGTTVKEKAKWPGTKMTEKSSAGYYVLDVDDYKNGKVIFTESTDATTNRYPADGAAGMSIGAASKKFGANHSWEDYTETKPEPEPEVPTVKSDKASGTSFTTETMDITLSLANAASGTYSVDGGPTKDFTSSATVTIGEGKIGDSTVTVATTAKGSDGTTKSYTFTYEKKYVVKTTSSSASSLASCYSTNGKSVGKEKTITIDGDPSDWSEDMMIAQSAAWDCANHWKGAHENSLIDAYALFAAWDDTNLYIGAQMVNTTDTWQNAGDASLMDNGSIGNVPMVLALSIDPSSPTMTCMENTTSKSIWSLDGLKFQTHVDRLFYMSGQPGNGEPSMFAAADSQGNTDYTNASACVGFKKGGIEYKLARTNICSSITGLNSSDSPSDVFSDSADWVDYKTYTGSKGKHDTKYDSFFEMKIPLATLGITKDYLTTYGIGAMWIGTRGESPIDCVPFDPSMIDNATGEYKAGDNTSLEKEDVDTITVSLARIGNGTITPTPTPVPTPTPTNTPLQVNFGTDKSAPQLTSTELTLKGIGIGGTAPYKYEFSVDGTVVKASSTTDTYSWKPGTKGKHTIQCVITDSTGATATVSKTFTAEGDDIVDPTPSTLVNNTTVSKTNFTVGETVNVNGAASGGTAPYTYEFYYKRSTASNWTSFGSNGSGTFCPGSAGTFTIKTYVKDSAGKSAVKEFTLTATEKTSTLTNNTTVSKTNFTVGETITVKGAASGGTAPYTYEFYYKRSTASSWTSFGSNGSGTFCPGSAGTFSIKTYVKDKTGKAAVKEITVAATAASLTNNTTVSKTNFTVGETITVKGAASGGTAPYTYEFYYKRSTASSWTSFGSNGSGTFCPGSAGTFTIKTYVKDKTGKASVKEFSLTATEKLTNKTTVSKTSFNVGETITVKGAASGGTAPYTYEFYYKRNTVNSWTSFGSNGSGTFCPGSAGTFTIRTFAKDKTGSTSMKDFTLTASNASLTNKTTVSKTSFNVGETITVKGAASGGTAPYTYEFYYKRNTVNSWTSFGSNGSGTFCPGSAGTFTIKTYVKDKTGKAAVKEFSLTASDAALTNKTSVSKTSFTVGETITVKGAASGGSGAYTYEFYYKRSTASSWTKFGSNGTGTFCPGSAGTFTIRTYAKDSRGASSMKEFTLTAKTGALTNNSSVTKTSFNVGEAVTVKGAAYGGSGSYTYEFYYKRNTVNSWTKFGNATTATFQPGSAGTFTVRVYVKDTAGSAASKDFTLTAK